MISRVRLMRTAVVVLNRVPRVLDPVVWTIAGATSYVSNRERRAIVRGNQRLALSARTGSQVIARSRLELSTYRAYYFYARYWVEVLRVQSLAPEDIVLAVDPVRAEDFVARRMASQPTIAVLAHVGNWEWGGAWVSLACNGVTAVAEALDDAEMTDWFLTARRRLGMEIVLTGGDVVRTLLKALRQGKLVALVVDRDVSGTGEMVDFLGTRVPLSSGPGVLSVMSGAPIYPVGTYQRRGRQEVRFYPPIVPPQEGTRAERVSAVMRQVAKALEVIVTEEPGQWHNFQKYELPATREFD
ncbi:MAG: lysophospholipid acyltransferase family protein [Ferrimicrobium sp.]